MPIICLRINKHTLSHYIYFCIVLQSTLPGRNSLLLPVRKFELSLSLWVWVWESARDIYNFMLIVDRGVWTFAINTTMDGG